MDINRNLLAGGVGSGAGKKLLAGWTPGDGGGALSGSSDALAAAVQGKRHPALGGAHPYIIRAAQCFRVRRGVGCKQGQAGLRPGSRRVVEEGVAEEQREDTE